MCAGVVGWLGNSAKGSSTTGVGWAFAAPAAAFLVGLRAGFLRGEAWGASMALRLRVVLVAATGVGFDAAALRGRGAGLLLVTLLGAAAGFVRVVGFFLGGISAAGSSAARFIAPIFLTLVAGADAALTAASSTTAFFLPPPRFGGALSALEGAGAGAGVASAVFFALRRVATIFSVSKVGVLWVCVVWFGVGWKVRWRCRACVLVVKAQLPCQLDPGTTCLGNDDESAGGRNNRASVAQEVVRCGCSCNVARVEYLKSSSLLCPYFNRLFMIL